MSYWRGRRSADRRDSLAREVEGSLGLRYVCAFASLPSAEIARRGVMWDYLVCVCALAAGGPDSGRAPA
jgi:hypothetical protein